MAAAGRVYGGLTPAERDAKRREQFLEAGREVFARRGWSNTTVQQLCRGAGLSQRYFYESFASREELFMAVVHRVAEEVDALVREAAAAPGAGADRSREVLRALAAYFTADPRTVSVALVESHATPQFRRFRAELIGRFAGVAADLMRELSPAPQRADQRSLELSALVLCGGIAEALVAAVSGRIAGSPDELVELLTRLYAAAAEIAVNDPLR